MDAMTDLLAQHFPHHKIITVLGMLADKATDLMLDKVEAFSHQLILTEPLSPRAKKCSSYQITGNRQLEPDYKIAIKKALSLSEDKTLVLIIGSFYLTCPGKAWLTTYLSEEG